MRRRLRSENVIYGQTKRDTEFATDLIAKDTKKATEKRIVSNYANNPRPKYEIYPGE